MLQTNLKQLFEFHKKMNAIGAPDARIVFVRAPYLQYEQILLRKNFRQYLEAIMLSSKVLKMGIQKKTYQKTYELQAGSQEFTVDFKGCDRQFDWLETSLLYDKSNKHLTIYDSYNAECAAGMIKKKKKNRAIEHIGRVQRNKYDEIQYLQQHSKTFAMETICCLAL